MQLTIRYSRYVLYTPAFVNRRLVLYGSSPLTKFTFVHKVQIRTRPRNFYSTITQIAVQIKASGEVFRVSIDG